MGPLTTGQENRDESIRNHLLQLWHIILDPHSKRDLLRFAVTITVVIALNAAMQIRLNDWQGNIYDAIGKKDLSIFLHEVLVFLIIVSVLLCLGVAQTWLHELLKVRLRAAITFHLLNEWLKPRRVFLLKQSGEISANPDQRVQDDARRLSELSVDLAVGLIQSSLLLIAFIGVLWELSSQVVFSVNGRQLTIPGYMVWTALAYSIIGSTVTWFVGRPLIEAHATLRAREADFRFSLVRVSESADEIALYRGEEAEKRFVYSRANVLLATMREIAHRLAALTWVTGGYGWLAILVPLLLAAPGYFGGSLSLGGLMMVVGGFYQVQSALRWFVDRFPAIAEWRAMLGRVSAYHSALGQLPAPGRKPGKIRYESGASAIAIDNVSVSWNGDLPLKVPNFKVERGERVVIDAVPKSGKSTFHKALAGLWSRGSGTICMPAGRILFLPQPPYVPMGTLRAALAYPDPGSEFGNEDVQRALERVGLGRYAPELDEEKRWDKELSLEDRRRVILGRVLLHRPEWVVQDESIYELDPESREIAKSIFDTELKDTAVLSIGRKGAGLEFYHRIIDAQPKLVVK